MSKAWKLEELAERAAVSPRTIRYYVQRGLLPAPDFKGRDTTYGEEHLARLRAIRALQERFLPLDRIQSELEGRDVEELAALIKKRASEPPKTSVTAAPSSSTAPSPAVPSARFDRYLLAEGLELHLDVHAPQRVHELARALLDHASTLADQSSHASSHASHAPHVTKGRSR